jgi:hypothetical protein
MAKRTARKVWMQVLRADDAAELSRLLAARRAEWSEWECKARGGNTLVYVPITPRNPKTRKPDPSMRYMERQWRVVPEPGGPFRLEYMRHTGQWWPVFDAVGDLKKIAGHIAEQAECLGYMV